MFNFKNVAEKIQSNAVKMMQNVVVPAAGNLDDKIATAVPVVQAQAAGLALKIAEQAKKLSDAVGDKGKTLNAKAAANYAALPVKEVKQVVPSAMTDEEQLIAKMTTAQKAAYYQILAQNEQELEAARAAWAAE